MLPVHKNHKRSITSVLKTIDKQLVQIKRWASGDNVEGVMYRENNYLSETQKEELLVQIDRLTALMVQIKENMDLAREEVDINRVIMGRSAVLWQNVNEMYSRHLKGYGDVSEEFAGEWDLQVDELIGCIDNIMAVISPP